MGTVDYRCKKCKKEYEVFYVSISAREKEEPEEKCPHCGSKKKEKMISKNVTFILKGTGWYKDGYGK